MAEPESLRVSSTVTDDGRLIIALAPCTPTDPGSGEVVVRIEAAPVNPSDVGLLLGPVDLASLSRTDERTLTGVFPASAMPALAGRLGEALAVGNEGAGTVVRVGPGAEHLLGTRVAVHGGGMYARYRTVSAADCLVLPDGVDIALGSASYVNPMTVLAMVETMRAEDHDAIVHTAAASNLGRMLNRLCLADGIPLVNIVRSAEQVALLRGEGAEHVVDSSAPDFGEKLGAAVAATGATLGFDAIGGGEIASRILRAMEKAAQARVGAAFSRYGTAVHKQIYVYGGLDMRPTVLDRTIGTAWGIGGFLLFTFLAGATPAQAARMRARVARDLTTIFASRFDRVVGMHELLDPAILTDIASRSTGRKVLVDPGRRRCRSNRTAP